MMTAPGRAQAIYTQIANTTPGFARLNEAERDQVMTNLVAIFGAGDLAYIKANAQVNPGSLTTPAGATTSNAAIGAPVTVLTPVQVTGLGTVS